MNNKPKKIKRNKGAAMLISVIFFLFITLAIISGLVTPSVREFRTANVNLKSKQSYFLAESGSEDAMYRILNSQTISSSETLSLNGNSATTNITTLFGNGKQITSLGDVSSLQRKVSLTLSTGAGVAFNYGIQAGNGGISVDGGSSVVGNIYSNSNINAISATITGSAIAADSPDLALDQSNNTPTDSPTSSITFRNVSASQDFAQSFQVATSSPVSKMQFYIKKVGSPSDATIRVVADNAGSPSTTVIPIGSTSLTASSVSTSYSWVNVNFATNPSLIPNATYWVVIDNSTQSTTNYYVLGANADSSYGNGTAKTGTYSGSWSAASLDGYFTVYTGGMTSLVGGATYSGGVTIGSAGVGDAWATTVKGATVAGNLYCTTGTNNNKACNTSHGDAPIVDLPFTDQNITDWKTAAAAGGTISGDYTVGSTGATLGPKKITGNLLVNGGGTLTLTGTLWVVGTVTITGGGKIKLPASYALNSETIVSDSWMSIAGGGSVGSGTSGSFLFVVSTSRCPYDTYCAGNSAIKVSGGAGAIAVDAENGNVLINGGASLDAVVGNTITITGGSDVTYNSGLASPSFSNGPSGGWSIGSWGESQ